MIILLGLPKSGTTSFHELFKKLGYKSYHWKKGNNYIGKMIENNKKTKGYYCLNFQIQMLLASDS